MRATPPHVTRNRWVRSSRRCRFFGISIATFGFSFAGEAALVLASPARPLTGDDYGGAALLVALAVVSSWVGVRCLRAGVLVSNRAVIVRGPFKTWHVERDAIERFDVGLSPHGGNPTGGTLLRRKADRPIFIWALARESFYWNNVRAAESFRGVAEGLNRILAEEGSAPSGPASARATVAEKSFEALTVPELRAAKRESAKSLTVIALLDVAVAVVAFARSSPALCIGLLIVGVLGGAALWMATARRADRRIAELQGAKTSE